MINPIFEIIGLLAAFLTTSAFIPQVYKIYKDKNADGISLTMYIILFIGVLLWLIYGVLIGSVSIIIANGITALLQLSIIIFKLKLLRVLSFVFKIFVPFKMTFFKVLFTSISLFSNISWGSFETIG